MPWPIAMEKEEFFYETLSAIGADVIADETPAPPSPPPPPTSSSSEIEPYIVLRNHISLSTVQCPSPESAAPDYFSLEVNEAVDKETPISATTLPSRESGQTSTPASERTLEGNWFRANSRFKSPMLRLHKGLVLLFLCFLDKFDWIKAAYKLSELGFCLVDV